MSLSLERSCRENVTMTSFMGHGEIGSREKFKSFRPNLRRPENYKILIERNGVTEKRWLTRGGSGASRPSLKGNSKVSLSRFREKVAPASCRRENRLLPFRFTSLRVGHPCRDNDEMRECFRKSSLEVGKKDRFSISLENILTRFRIDFA